MHKANLELSGLPTGPAIDAIRAGRMNYTSKNGVGRYVTDVSGNRVGELVHLRRGLVVRLDALALPPADLTAVVSAWAFRLIQAERTQ